jgi:hypothetical protein
MRGRRANAPARRGASLPIMRLRQCPMATVRQLVEQLQKNA